MATTSLCLSLSSPTLSSILNPKPQYSLNTHCSSLSVTLPITSKRTLHFPHQIPLKPTQFWRTSAVTVDSLPSEANPVENTEQIVSSTGDDGVFSIVSILLFVAFIGLSILTIGVIYIAVTDFLQKREREKFEKEEAAKKKKSGKKGKLKLRARPGPRGFGQKIEDDEEELEI